MDRLITAVITIVIWEYRFQIWGVFSNLLGMTQ